MGKKGFIELHDKSVCHREAVASWEEFKLNKKHHATIDHQLDSDRTQLTESNKHYIKTLAEVLRLCS